MYAEQSDHKDSFYKSFRPVLIFGQLCGLIPLRGIFGSHHSRLRFVWLNPTYLYAGVLFAVTSFFAYCHTAEVSKYEIKFDRIAGAVFYATVVLINLMFLNLARKFPEIASDFHEAEKNMAEYGYPKRMGLKMLIFVLVTASLAVAEHGTLVFMIAKRAERMAYFEHMTFGRAFFYCMFHEISIFISYNPVATVIMFWSNVICTMSWNYIDFFLIAISIQLTSRLRLINDRVSTIDLKKENRLLWRKISEDYNRISLLVKKLDKYLSSLIITSIVNDLYHLSLQLLRSLKIEGSIFQKCYHYSSMFFLIGRLLTVTFCASSIEEESKNSLDLLYCIKEPCPESNRFLHQVVTDDVYFTGKRFFIINRTFMVTLVGTLITYQIVLFQMNSLNFFSD